MTVTELRKQLVSKIGKIDDNELLEEMFRLVKNGMLDEEPAKDSSDKKVKKANGKKKQTSGDDSMDDDIDMWLRNMAF
jgi:hypothetical protein